MRNGKGDSEPHQELMKRRDRSVILGVRSDGPIIVCHVAAREDVTCQRKQTRAEHGQDVHS